ncbi:hypothetical protein KUH03_13720 [Sphingobacterium sp. E70]|uniref:hypothetical protein n=1 Tax=Sphingobacterium sp. E70 TaxID=2853439 RepID=UPI00211C7A01|nr:hypothetical protein [Sphingobacterium sp. E70]ULT27666.1 hypothetical protein KUH03_13720 [Sphingobacterium sp. E70]
MNKFLILPLALGIAYQGQAFPVKSLFLPSSEAVSFRTKLKGQLSRTMACLLQE